MREKKPTTKLNNNKTSMAFNSIWLAQLQIYSFFQKQNQISKNVLWRISETKSLVLSLRSLLNYDTAILLGLNKPLMIPLCPSFLEERRSFFEKKMSKKNSFLRPIHLEMGLLLSSGYVFPGKQTNGLAVLSVTRNRCFLRTILFKLTIYS